MHYRNERRRYDRYQFRGTVSVTWESHGLATTAVGNCVDISVSGMLVELPCALVRGAAVKVDFDAACVYCDAAVRHCRPYGPWFRIGLHFNAPFELPTACEGAGALVEGRRKERRYAVHERATVTMLTGAVSSARAIVLDVSRSGLRIRVEHPLWKGTQIKVNTKEVIMFGEVRYCRAVPAESGYDVGICIDQVIGVSEDAAPRSSELPQTSPM